MGLVLVGVISVILYVNSHIINTLLSLFIVGFVDVEIVMLSFVDWECMYNK